MPAHRHNLLSSSKPGEDAPGYTDGVFLIAGVDWTLRYQVVLPVEIRGGRHRLLQVLTGAGKCLAVRSTIRHCVREEWRQYAQVQRRFRSWITSRYRDEGSRIAQHHPRPYGTWSLFTGQGRRGRP